MPHRQKEQFMDPSTPMVLADASYASRGDAVEAFMIVWDGRHQGEFAALRPGRSGHDGKD
jgi:hypothetical protein